jgi:octaprenyl-diphosphate synthase
VSESAPGSRGSAWVDAALDEVRARLAHHLATLPGFKLVPSGARVTGKLLRPRLLLILTAATAEDVLPIDRAAALATALELIHVATLHHDDVLDDSPQRRRAASVREVFGNKISILFGDVLVAGAVEIVLRSASRSMQFAVIRAVTATLRGEVEQHLGHRVLDVAETQCVKVAALKTGSLFGLAARLGALLGGVDPRVAATASRLGRRLGTAFQLIDDALDYAEGPELLGKEPGSDYRQGIATLPLMLAWRAASDDDRHILEAGFGGNGDSDFAAAREIVLRADHFEACLATARRQLARALVDAAMLGLGERASLLTAYVAELEHRLPDPDHVRRLSGAVG